MHVCSHVCEGQRSMLMVISWSVPCSLRQGLSLKPALTNSAVLAEQSSRIMCLCLASTAMPGKPRYFHRYLHHLLHRLHCLVVLKNIFRMLIEQSLVWPAPLNHTTATSFCAEQFPKAALTYLGSFSSKRQPW